MSYLKDYLLYNQGNECPEKYHIWGSFMALALIMTRRVYLDMSYFKIYPNLYITLVGPQGNRKTVARDIAFKIATKANPALVYSAECTTKEAITKEMAKDSNKRVIDMHGEKQIITPYAICVTELKNFLAVNPQGMTDFLTTIYDRDHYDYKPKHGEPDVIERPCVNFFACEVPDWLVANMRNTIISGGFCRRMIFVCDQAPRKHIPFPSITPEAAAAYTRCLSRLTELNKISGEFIWADDTKAAYSKWYCKDKKVGDSLVDGFLESIHIQVLKIAMLVSLSETDDLVLQKRYFEFAVDLLQSVVEGLPMLSAGVGRNELATQIPTILNAVITAGGALPIQKLKSLVFNSLNGQEFDEVFKHLVNSGQLEKLTLRQTGTDITKTFVAIPSMRDALLNRMGAKPNVLDADLKGVPTTPQSSAMD